MTFFFKQLNKKFKFSLSLLSIKYDIVRKLPSIHGGLLNHFTKELNIKRAFEVEPLVFQQKAATKLKATALPQSTLSAVAVNDNVLPKFEFKPVNSHIELNQKTPVLYKELSLNQLIAKLKRMKVGTASIKAHSRAY